jgi:hypothetical protein
MNTDDLIRLAQKADLEGDMELADYLDNQLIRVSQSLKQRLKNFFAPVTNFVKKQSLPKYDVDFKNLKSDASNLNMIAGHPAPFGNKAQKFFQYGVKNIERSPERLVQIGDMIKGRIKSVITNDPTVQSAITKFNNNQKLNVKERNALLNHLVNNEQIAKRNNDISPDDIIKVLDGKVPDVTTKQVTTLSNAAKSAAGLGVAGAGALGIGAYNASQQNAGYQPGGVYQDPNSSGSPFQEMPEMGGGMPSMGEMPQGGGGGGGYQGPSYSMPSADQSFQSMEGYRPANQVDQLPIYNDQAEPLYPRISPQQAMQNAMYVDKARRFDELNANANRPADAPIVGPGTPSAPSSPSSNEFNFAKEYGLRPATLEEAQKFPLPPTPQEQQASQEQAPAVPGVGQAIDLSNPTGFNPANPFNIQ